MKWIILIGILIFCFIILRKTINEQNVNKVSKYGNNQEIKFLVENGVVALLNSWNLLRILPQNAINTPVMANYNQFPNYIEYMKSERMLLNEYTGVVNNILVKVHIFENCLVGQMPANTSEAIAVVMAPEPESLCIPDFDKFTDNEWELDIVSLAQCSYVNIFLQELNNIENGTSSKELTIENTLLMDIYNIIISKTVQ